MTTPQHHNDQNEFADSMPRATKGVVVIWDTGSDTDKTECGDGFEEDIVDVKARGRDRKGVTLYDTYEEEADEDPPRV